MPATTPMPPLTPSHPLARTSTLVLAIVATIAVLFLWRSIQDIDIAISRTFYLEVACSQLAPQGKTCGYFPLIEDAFMRQIRIIGYVIPLGLMVIMLLWGLGNLIAGYNPNRRNWQAPLAGTIAGLLGPLIIVNLVLKTFKGRARPYQVDTFGGDAQFTLPGTITDQCDFNCSFPSGEAAAATWMLVLVPFLPASWRRNSLAIILFLIIAISFLRVAFGRHFTSDVTMGVMLTLVSIAASFWLVARVPSGWHRIRGTRGKKLETA
ncbi:phosphatase PAP2 family protein [Pseudahrensia aquimaris]|uniref:Phosphatase PAP2 family protein n=1 Tax=Pseudahrensia aquimaris TaxID=744461 RepID=A0ABW3FIC7_9HYPH